MTKLRKQRRNKGFRHNINRKRLRDKLFNSGKIECKDIKEAWHYGKSVRRNLLDMGLSYDPNQTIKIPNTKEKFKRTVPSKPSKTSNEWLVEDVKTTTVTPSKSYVANKLETDAKAPRVKLFRLPKGQVEWITYLMDKYGTDYKAMVRDKKNYNQETWKQLRAKINRFKSITQQYEIYLKERGLNSNNIHIASDISDSE